MVLSTSVQFNAPLRKRQRKIPKAQEFLDIASIIIEKTSNSFLRFQTVSHKCLIAELLGDAQEMINLVYEARKSGGFTSNRMEEEMLMHEAGAHLYLGNLPRALSVLKTVEEIMMANGMESSSDQIFILDIQADVHWRKSEYAQAHKLQTEVAFMTSPSSSPLFHANALAMVAYFDITMAADEAGILRNLDAAQEVYKDLEQSTLLCSWVMAELYLYRGDTENACITFEESLSRSQGTHTQVLGSCLGALGDMKCKMNNVEVTFHWAFIYFSFVHKSKDRVATFRALRCLADVYKELHDEDTALNLYHTVLEGAIKMDIHRLRAESMTGIGDIMLRRGELTQAKEMWEAAHPLFVTSSQMKDAVAVDERLARVAETPACIQLSEVNPDDAKPILNHHLGILSAQPSTPLVEAENSWTEHSEHPLEDNSPVLVYDSHRQDQNMNPIHT
ncbi:hypothetical protein DFH09DRAFT_1087447 [Mycena vulgaris]|nr:hypothetical protein DFH09DRAFT_1087447 [Mycena vulgaris]